MKYYIYVSDSKVSMLYSQIAQMTGQSREASLGVDVKVLKGHIKESRGIPENSLIQLDQVINQLKASKVIGSIDDPKQYIGGVLPMTWCTYGGGPITFWGFCEEKDYPFSGTVLALAGSKYHLLGEQRDGHTHSHSLTGEMTSWFLENIEDPFDASAKKIENSRLYSRVSLDNYDVANGAWLAATQASGTSAKYEFIAKVLHKSEWPDGFRMSGTRRVILSSPLYVTIAE